jgi:hypothetical protein
VAVPAITQRTIATIFSATPATASAIPTSYLQENFFISKLSMSTLTSCLVQFVAFMSGSHLVLSEQLRLLQDEIALLRTSCRVALSEADAVGLIRAPKMPIDDVFLLRFLLSNGRAAATAADNLSACIRWRIQNREKIAAIHNGLPFKGEFVRSMCITSLQPHRYYHPKDSQSTPRARRLWSATALGKAETFHVRWCSRCAQGRIAHRHRACWYLEHCRYTLSFVAGGDGGDGGDGGGGGGGGGGGEAGEF